MKPIPANDVFDFSLLRAQASHHEARNHRLVLLLAFLLTLLLLSGAGLVAYLRTFEAEEEIRTQVADALWLEQTVHFHLKRLEDDLESLALKEVEEPGAAKGTLPAPGGSLRSFEGGLLGHAWQAAGADVPASLLPRWTQARVAPLNAQALDSMHDIARGLRRPAYAGPLERTDRTGADEMWLSVPIFDRGNFLGSYLAVFSLNNTLNLIVPGWFRKNHRLEVLDPGADFGVDANSLHSEHRFLTSIDMPGSDTYLQIYQIHPLQATVPRALLGVALVFLIGMVASLYFLRRDIEKRQRAEESLAAQVALRQSMEDSIDVGLFARNSASIVLYANRAFCRIVGVPPETLFGTKRPIPGWPNLSLDEELLHHEEITFLRLDGRTAQLLIHTVPLVHAKEGQIGWMTSVVDVTDRRRAERAAQLQQHRLESAGRLVAIGEVASTLAHELNQPLGALSSFSNGLLNRLNKGNIEPDQVRSIIERINTLAEKTGQIIRRVNAFARRREMLKERVDLTSFLRDRYSSGESFKVPVQLWVPAVSIGVRADVILLEQAVHNVVQNAAEAAASASPTPQVQIGLTLSDDGSHALVSVSDNGDGIDGEDRGRLFDAFYSSKVGGMGMGLAICRSILEAHHGRVDLLSDSDLGGATFRLWLPVDNS